MHTREQSLKQYTSRPRVHVGLHAHGVQWARTVTTSTLHTHTQTLTSTYPT